jgi:uncharacterized membrane protein YjjB (DUF3815 family)
MGTAITPLYLIEDVFWAGLATLGFAFLFNVPRRLLLACVLCGAAGHVLRQVAVVGFGLPIETATLLGAMAVGFLGYLLAYRLHAPAIIFQVASSIPLVPGAFAYQTMLALIRVPAGASADLAAPLETAALFFIRTALILAAIGAGIAAPTLLFRRRAPITD